jgi:diguanylate cyclase (GGDEF)-like protein
LALLAALYFIAGKFGLSFASVHASVSAVWPPTGIALAAFLILGYRAWPAIFLGAFLVNVTTAGTILTAVGIATGNTLEGLMGWYLVSQFAGGRNAFDRTQDIFKFTFLAAMLSTAVSSTFGVTSLCLTGFASWADYSSMWWTWWQGDAVGALVITPMLLHWSSDFRIRWARDKMIEAVALGVLFVFVALTLFVGIFPFKFTSLPVEFLCIPFIIWAAFRFGPREAATAIAVLAGIAVWGTVRGYGPFVRSSQNASLLLLQAFVGVMVVLSMILGAEVNDRKCSMEKVRQMAVSDPLTGLANYRLLVDVLDAEIKRFGRTGRPFAILILDLDGLKRINDTYGHLAGSRAIRRVAEIIRVLCRATDTAARYGGDEFVIVLPEANLEGAQLLSARIIERLAQDIQPPPLSVCVGTALYPHDGGTVTELLRAADRALYVKKRQSKLVLPYSVVI